ncbi:MAG TPA: ABC transporter ATP-binding protein [Gammaproteobacteria bacterium]|nr:ABC transporter ATP-binding protein [Gammaproteobacteria bacterium]
MSQHALATAEEDIPPSGYNWKYIFDVAREHKRALLIANIVAVISVLASIPIPLLFPLLVDEVLLQQPGVLVAWMDGLFPQGWHGPMLYVLFILLVTVLLRVGALAMSIWQVREFTLIAKDITFRIRASLLQRLQRISMAEYETLGSGAVASHFVTDLNAIDEFIGQSIAKSIISALTVVGIAAVLLWMHWQLALFILLMNPLVIYFTMVLGKKVKHLKKKENAAFEIFQQALTETLDAIQQIRASNREGFYLRNVIDKARNIKSHSAAFSWKSDAASRFSFGVFLLGFDVFRAITMLMVVFSNLTVGEMMAVFGYLWFMMAPVQELLNIQYAFFGAKAALARVNRLLCLEQEPRYPHKKNPFAGKKTVGLRVEDLCFRYHTKTKEGEESPLVLDHVNLHVRAGEKVALVGASGGGKSTLVQVILGMYAPQEGMLYFDEVPVSEIGLDVVRENVATVLQHPAMFNDTVRMNLSLGLEFTDAQLWQALTVAQLREVVESMPEELDTIVGTQGIRLSGGQRQRLAIARMVLADPKVVILDEATSALDAQTEARLHDALRDFLDQRTTLIIAHRLSAVKQAERVLVFDGGRIIEEGSHEDLLQNDGLYKRLYGKLQH